MEIRIKGTIIGYSEDVSAGLLRCDDGRKYMFTKSEWVSPQRPVSQAPVTFELRSGQAVQVKA